MKNLIDLTGRIILVIGASAGIGRQTAITLSEAGARLVLVARNEERLNETLSLLEGEGHRLYSADISVVGKIEDLIRRITAEAGPLDGMVYTAGMEAPIPLMQARPEKVQEVFDVNFFGFFETVRQVTKKGRYHPGMRIVAVSSCASLCGKKGRAIYSASKSAMDSAIRCFAAELASKDICINSVAPAMTATQMFERYADSNNEESGAYKRQMDRQYLGMGQPEDVANAIAFLISPAARFITGITMPVDGGYTTS